MPTSNLRRTVAGVVAAGMIATAGAGSALAKEPTAAILRAAAEMTAAYDLPAGLLLAVAETESDFDPACRTGKCVGLMQIHSSYAAEYARAAGLDTWDLYDPADSLRIAASMLDDYMRRYEGDIHFALMCYNLGEYGALRKLAEGVESTGYSRKVIGRIERWADYGLPEPPQAAEPEPAEPEPAEQPPAVFAAVWDRIKEVLFA